MPERTRAEEHCRLREPVLGDDHDPISSDDATGREKVHRLTSRSEEFGVCPVDFTLAQRHRVRQATRRVLQQRGYVRERVALVREPCLWSRDRHLSSDTQRPLNFGLRRSRNASLPSSWSSDNQA